MDSTCSPDKTPLPFTAIERCCVFLLPAADHDVRRERQAEIGHPQDETPPPLSPGGIETSGRVTRGGGVGGGGGGRPGVPTPLIHLNLHPGRLVDTSIQSQLQEVYFSGERETTVYLCHYSKDVHRTKCQALSITRLTHSPYITEIARIRRYTMLSTIFKCQDVQHTIRA